MRNKRKIAASKAALVINLVDKIYSPEVKIVKESIEEFCIAKEFSRVLAMSAFLRAALAQYGYALLEMGYNGKETISLIKRIISETLETIEFKEEEK